MTRCSSFFEAVRRADLELWRATPREDRARYGLHRERGPESYELTFRLTAGHDLIHMAQARKALAQVRNGRYKPRCSWALGDPLLTRYHDDEWGKPVRDERHLFEMLTLEGFQAGLSWLTILRKREAFRARSRALTRTRSRASTTRIATRLMSDAGIVRNRAKIDATIGNARAFLATTQEFGSFAAYLARRSRRRHGVCP